MRFIHGDADEPMLMDRNRLPSADVVAGRAQALTTVLARLHHVSLSDLRLSDEPVTSPSAEASRWMGMFHGGAASPALSLGHRLQDTAPEPLSPVLQHGDFRLGNAICQGRNVAAVIDWEIWSIGDPRTDLAWLLMRAAPDQLHAGMPPAPGMPTSEDLLTSYASEVDSPPAEMAWFSALVRYKYAAVVSQLASRGGTSDQRIAAKVAAVPALLDDVDRLLRARSPWS
jgi:aminoglycoside phosphotransferase (APT) family kinase protein